MAFSVVMPALEMAQETGKLVAWLKKEGESVAKGQPLLEIETDKAVMEIEAPADGVLAGVKAAEGDVVPVGQTIAWIVAPGEVPPVEAAPAETGRRMSAAAASAASPTTAAAPAAAAVTGTPRISPKARRLAKEQGVDISKLRGSGPGGEILASDVLAAAQAPTAPATPAAPAGDLEALGAVGRLM